MAAQHLVQRGVRWHVGDGKMIKIWRDKMDTKYKHLQIHYAGENTRANSVGQ